MSPTHPAPVRIVSFGYGHGAAPEAHLTIDLREHFRDPHVRRALRARTFTDRAVQRTVLGTPGIRPLLAALVAAVRAYDAGPSGRGITVAVGCVGGRHRSATVAHVLGRRLTRRGHRVTVVHRDVHRPVIERPAIRQTDDLTSLADAVLPAGRAT